MAITNHERVGKALELLKDGLGPFVDRELKRAVKAKRISREAIRFDDPNLRGRPATAWDAAALLKVMWDFWNAVFRDVLGPGERNFVNELRGHRNKWAHQEPFSSDDAYRALDTASRLLKAVSAEQAAEVDGMKSELLRLIHEEQARSARRRQARLVPAGTASEGADGLKPWRSVVFPHRDVRRGSYEQAEFAADLWQVHQGQGASEYRDPVEFFNRTYLTASLRAMLCSAMRRLSGVAGDPVVQLQTNFGGGKTHSMLALYHLFADTGTGASIKPGRLEGIEDLMQEAGVDALPSAKPVVLVGNRVAPGSPSPKTDGAEVHTMWGELAWQLGGREAWERIAEDDRRATNPGDALRELLLDHSPCLILIDEWVAYARQLHDDPTLPGGTFETQFTFAQTLTETVKATPDCLLVVSLPASDVGATSSEAENIEVGGSRGREALHRLQNVIGRIEAAWRPATAEEGFEIVRRRLFEPLRAKAHPDRDVTARRFVDLYGDAQADFPPECREREYEQRIRNAYPIHPEVFDRLYTDWSTLPTFQRTRGVLRLMAAVIHALWQRNDSSPLILPGHLPVDDPRVQPELIRYLPDNWPPVIGSDIDGERSLPVRLDSEHPNLGRLQACRRVARTIFLGSAPSASSKLAGSGREAQRGLDDRRVKLGCAVPGEPQATYGDALRRLSDQATYLYQDGNRYWHDVRPTVAKLAADRAEQLLADGERIEQETLARLRRAVEAEGRGAGFARIHVAPRSADDVPDEREIRLVILGPGSEHRKDGSSPAQTAARALLDSRGRSPRIFRNTLVFLAPDQTQLQDLREAVSRLLAWESILDETGTLDLSNAQKRTAEVQAENARTTVAARLPETWCWLVVPEQTDPAAEVTWKSSNLRGGGPLAQRAGRKLRRDEDLLGRIGSTLLRHELDSVPLWRGEEAAHVELRQLADDFASYLYLPRLEGPHVLLRSVEEGLALLTWEQETFAWAEAFDEPLGRHRGLRCGQAVALVDADSPGLLVRPEAARRQLDADREAAAPDDEPTNGDLPQPQPGGDPPPVSPPPQPKPEPPNRYFGSVSLDAARAGLDASRIADEVVSHLAGLVGAEVEVTLEIAARIPTGAPEQVVRTVTENSRTLKFKAHGFERE